MIREFLVTGQGYEKEDKYKQTVLLHDSFMAKDEYDAQDLFNQKFQDEYKIIKIYSSIDISTNNGY